MEYVETQNQALRYLLFTTAGAEYIKVEVFPGMERETLRLLGKKYIHNVTPPCEVIDYSNCIRYFINSMLQMVGQVIVKKRMDREGCGLSLSSKNSFEFLRTSGWNGLLVF
ncbi:hypothetical protein ACFPES_31100 [Paenibacillus sp. GCM10023248]|nr:hypothetical protein [Paenibacillus sp. MAHUQ-63]